MARTWQCVFATIFLSQVIGSSVPVPSLAGVDWKKSEVAAGLEWQSANGVSMFGKTHNLNVLVASPGQRKLEIMESKGKLEKTSQLATANGVLAAINGGYHTYGGSVEDVTAVKINGVVKREDPVDDLKKWDLTEESVEGVVAIDSSGRAKIYKSQDSGWKSMPSYLQSGPLLVYSGAVQSLEDRTWNKVNNPRTAVCVKSDGKELLITVDGRSDASEGMSVYEFASYCKALGCEDALNLDGGASTTMYIKGKGVVNEPRANNPFNGPLKEHGVLTAIGVN